MGNLIPNQKGMTSLEVAEVTGKQHAHVMRDIRNLLSQGASQSNFGLGSYTDANGQERPLFNLSPKGCLILASGYDVVLREGDVIYIPEFVNTVKISGSVMYPNTVAWEKGAKLKYYINMAGGYGNMAKKKKAYIIYLNGTVARAKRSSGKLIQPGCEIVVPSKAEKQHMKFAEILGISSTTATMAAMVATLVNAFK